MVINNERVLSVLKGVSRAPGCWCSHGIGNPMVNKCSQACQEAQSLVKDIELASEPDDPPIEMTLCVHCKEKDDVKWMSACDVCKGSMCMDCEDDMEDGAACVIEGPEPPTENELRSAAKLIGVRIHEMF